ncbi:MAG: VWA domain-containing protein [Candidatus Eisenbacteria bacterium]|uniref:VWA domain-containing protein n=1 Tax=Eiseniibacteriota bacterium TaxID=2212470 RepID=A0A948RW25_UNCEI|nr:VWA domain-containing protein [Candidatus Eisenbacteria bacterium]MBU1948249.1 VWA domain-containing protein [Candidatus Eisenbacteria bacterium]MBU2690557.1 VWA domain-containing protein [Candidatus Eisenbacteria bacterium]
MNFGQPGFLLLLLLVPLLIVVRRTLRLRGGVLFSDVDLIKGLPIGRARLAWIPGVLEFTTLILLVIALAHPQKGESEQKVVSEGLDIILALDISGSMKAEDFQPKNRLDAAKIVAGDFILGRPEDRIGLVVFAADSYTQCPLTVDHKLLLELVDNVTFGEIRDGTAIGMALANSLARLKDIPAPSKVVILLTDGQNNSGTIDPLTSASMAKALGVRVYTIGVGTLGEAPYPVDDPILGRHYVNVPSAVDDVTLQAIADSTGGRYYRATDSRTLEMIFSEIDQLELRPQEMIEHISRKDVGVWAIWPALGCLMLQGFLTAFWFRRLP